MRPANKSQFEVKPCTSLDMGLVKLISRYEKAIFGAGEMVFMPLVVVCFSARFTMEDIKTAEDDQGGAHESMAIGEVAPQKQPI